jgi:hypothetical protein
VDFPGSFLFLENEKLIVCFPDRCLALQNLGLSRGCRSDIGQVPHFHDFMDGEAYVQFDSAKDLIIAGFNRIATASAGECCGMNTGSSPYRARAASALLVLSDFS